MIVISVDALIVILNIVHHICKRKTIAHGVLLKCNNPPGRQGAVATSAVTARYVKEEEARPITDVDYMFSSMGNAVLAILMCFY